MAYEMGVNIELSRVVRWLMCLSHVVLSVVNNFAACCKSNGLSKMTKKVVGSGMTGSR